MQILIKIFILIYIVSVKLYTEINLRHLFWTFFCADIYV